MSCVRKEKNGVYYYYWYCLKGCVRHPEGGWQHGKSLHVRDGKTAGSMQKSLDVLHEDQRRYLTLGRPIPKAEVHCTLAQWQKLYFAEQHGKMPVRTLATYEQTLRHFIAYIGAERKLQSLDRVDMDRYYRYCTEERKLALGTMLSRRAMLKSMFADAVKREYLTSNPIDHLHKPKVGKSKKQPLSREQLAKALSISDEPWSTLFEATYLTGGRIEELLKLKRRWINRSEEHFTFVDPKEKHAKTNHLYPELRACFDRAERLSGPVEYVFMQTNGDRISRRLAYAHIRAIGEKIGIGIDAEGNPKKPYLGPHILRHSRITHLLEDGVPIIDVMGIVGHNNLSTTQGYAHTSANRQKEIADKLTLGFALRSVHAQNTITPTG